MKNKRIVGVILIALMVLLVGAIGGTGWYFLNTKNNLPKTNYTSPEPDSTYFEINEKYTDRKIVDGASAIESINDIKDSMGITDAKKEFTSEDKCSMGNKGWCTYRLNQEYKGIPVYGRFITVIVDSSENTFGLTTNYVSLDKNFSINTKFSEEEAIKSVIDYMQKNFSCKKETINTGITELIIDTMNSPSHSLAYIIETVGENDNGNYYMFKLYVNANTNEVYYKESMIHSSTSITVRGQNGNQYIHAEVNDNSVTLINDFRFSDSTVSRIIISVPSDIEENKYNWFIDKDKRATVSFNKNNKNEINKSAVDAMANISTTMNYYYNVLGRKSFNNKSEDLNVCVNIQGYLNEDYEKEDIEDNAFYSSYNNNKFIAFTIRTGNQKEYSANLDVVGHEFTHGVIAETAKFGNNPESGSLDEAYGDIIGNCIEDSLNNFITDWKMEKNGRNIKDPNKTNNPKHMSEFNSSNDFQWNSTIISHVAYLMWNGGPKGRWTKIEDTETLARLWYDSLRFLDSKANFSQCRNAVEKSAIIMWSENDISEKQYDTIRLAFEEVGISNNMPQEIRDETKKPAESTTKNNELLDILLNNYWESRIQDNRYYDFNADGTYRVGWIDGYYDTDKEEWIDSEDVVTEKIFEDSIKQKYTLNGDELALEIDWGNGEKHTTKLKYVKKEEIPNLDEGLHLDDKLSRGEYFFYEIGWKHSGEPSDNAMYLQKNFPKSKNNTTITKEGRSSTAKTTTATTTKKATTTTKKNTSLTKSKKYTFNGHKYQLFEKTGLNYNEAKKHCESIGGHLVTITTNEEQEFVSNMIKSGSSHYYWLGANCNNAQGQWKWITGETWSYEKWAYGQPDSGNFINDGENYLQMYRLSNPSAESYLGEWNDITKDCSYPDEDFFNIMYTGFICEWEQ